MTDTAYPTAERLRSLLLHFGRREGALIDSHALEGMTVPDSRGAREATELCRSASSASLVNHCFRSYAWAALLGLTSRLRWDPELLYVAAMLHDIGLTPRFDRGGCFEADGAMAPKEFLRELGWGEARADHVADAIYLHMHTVTAEDTTEAQLLDLGAAVDVRGARLSDITPANRAAVVRLFPRLGFKEHFTSLIEAQAAAKPGCVAARYLKSGAANEIRAADFAE